mmetsp:Transcript_8174/g.27084  ORF Transcript_8174/g.27084 Transcript_8174/m.27084 type:complete len:202 (-) Transcript_8174:1141-1746(-)
MAPARIAQRATRTKLATTQVAQIRPVTPACRRRRLRLLLHLHRQREKHIAHAMNMLKARHVRRALQVPIGEQATTQTEPTLSARPSCVLPTFMLKAKHANLALRALQETLVIKQMETTQHARLLYAKKTIMSAVTPVSRAPLVNSMMQETMQLDKIPNARSKAPSPVRRRLQHKKARKNYTRHSHQQILGYKRSHSSSREK